MTVSKLFTAAALATASLIPLALLPGAAEASPAQAESGFKAEADALLADAFPADGPGASAVVMRGGEPVYAAGRGLADVGKGRPITPDTVFRLGSITKQFTAALVLKLAEEGRISLDDPLSRFFPDWPQPAAGATVRQLLNHASGIQDFSKIPGWIARNRTRAVTTDELVALSRGLPAKAAPGEAWEYNNGGYVLLGAIVEQVTGKPWHEAFEERIARPLGLETVRWGGFDQPGAALGYTVSGGRQQPAELSNMSVPHAAGGLVGSARDMARWAQALHQGRVVAPALYREMIAPARMKDGRAESYGFGLRLRELRGRPALVHGGAIAGFDTDSLYIPSEDLFVAVFANSDDPATDPSVLTRRLAALALGEPIPVFARAEADLAALAPLFGTYEGGEGPARRFFAEGGKLYLARGEGRMEAFAAGEDRFFFGPGVLSWLRFERRADGAHVLEVHRPEDAAPVRAVRTGEAPPPLALDPALLRAYAGTWQTEGPVLTIAIDAGGGLTIQAPGGEAMAMRPVSDTEFVVDAARTRIVFHPEDGAVNRLTMQRGARQMSGRRVD